MTEIADFEVIRSDAAWIPPDQAERERIRHDLDTNLLVEAGAGSGKTTAMAGRMVELIRTGTAEIDQIAAVTFTRKAAAELRERFQEKLEEAYRELSPEPSASPGERASVAADNFSLEATRLERALQGIDRCFTGTIHAFCGRLLRERPLEAHVPPGFQEVSGPMEDRLRAECWARFLEQLANRRSRLLRRLSELGLRPSQLVTVFEAVSGNPDVIWRAGRVERPSHAEVDAVRRALESLLDDCRRLMPHDEPRKGWDSLQKKIRSLRFRRFAVGWEDDSRFLDALALALGGKNEITQYKWGSEGATKAAAKGLCARWDDFCGEGGAAARLLDRWLVYRYPTVLRFARAAAAFYARERIRTGHLNFQDLLLLSARLLRTNHRARRDLGERYRFLLVDEFQDTDPLQAEVIFLLSDDGGCDGDWQRAVPKPGALFVVGDPKQSIYRFRRADISVYNRVKHRFMAFGAALPLVANFRSTPPIEQLVDNVFDSPDAFPTEETEYQARFAPLRVRPQARAQQGVFWYSVDDPEGGKPSKPRLAQLDAALLAAWIDQRIRSGERTARDFMILTRITHHLVVYARALEARGIPVRVSGAKVGMERELKELLLLLRALANPGDEVLTLAVLEGLFFGLSHDDLYAHRHAGGAFQFTRSSQPDGPARPALLTLREFWRWTRDAPADVAVPRIVESLGLLPFAAAGELGATRAGALLYALDALRTAALDGQTSLADAVEVLDAALTADADTPLMPGETDAVQLMNLHKAKGLEAPVVVLANPTATSNHDVERHIARGDDGLARGWLLVKDGARGPVIARPPGWQALAAAEEPFLAAEEVRLLYVATTRAADELVVARCATTATSSVWAALHPTLDEEGLATELAIMAPKLRPRDELHEAPEAVRARVLSLNEARGRLSGESYRVASVSTRVHGKVETPHAPAPVGERGGTGRGAEWGTAVHSALEAAGKGMTGPTLRDACRRFLRDAYRESGVFRDPFDATELATLNELITLAENVHRSPLWQRASRSERVLMEMPFSISFPVAQLESLGLDVTLDGSEARAPLQIVEGVIDLAFREAAGWVIADYKSDVFSSAERRRERTEAYRRQVDLYGACWERIIGEPVIQRVLFFTQYFPGPDSVMSW